MYKIAPYFFAFMIQVSTLGFGQEHAPADTKTLMRADIIGGIQFNTRGWGFSLSYGKQKNYKYKQTFGLTFTNLRHEKEQKIYPDVITSTKGYFYGKLNSLVSLRPTYGGKRLLFPAERENGIEVLFKWEVGPSIGLLKPVYLKIDKLNALSVDERYNPTIHNAGNINSRSSWFKGLGEASLVPGIYARVGTDFNFSPVREVISGGEFGFVADYFFSQNIDLLYNNDEQAYFLGLYLQLNFGRRLY